MEVLSKRRWATTGLLPYSSKKLGGLFALDQIPFKPKQPSFLPNGDVTLHSSEELYGVITIVGVTK